MNVLFLSQIVPYPPHGGVLQRGYNIIRELNKFAEIHLLAFLHPDVLNSRDSVLESQKALKQHCTSVDYFPLWPKKNNACKAAAYLAGFVASAPFSVIAHRSRAFERSIQKILSEKSIDIVHFDTIALAQYNSDSL